MIFGQLEVVFSGIGDCEIVLIEVKARFILEFESLITIILDGPYSSTISRLSPNEATDDWGFEEPQTLGQQWLFVA